MYEHRQKGYFYHMITYYYIGTTKQTVKNRMAGHFNNIQQMSTKTYNQTHSLSTLAISRRKIKIIKTRTTCTYEL